MGYPQCLALLTALIFGDRVFGLYRDIEGTLILQVMDGRIYIYIYIYIYKPLKQHQHAELQQIFLFH